VIDLKGSLAFETAEHVRQILFVINSPIVGGAERHTFDLAAYLTSRGYSCTIFSMKSGALTPAEGIPLLQPLRPRSLAKRIGDLSKTIRNIRPDLIIAVNERPVFACFMARLAARSRLPIIAITHSTLLRTLREELMQLVYTPLFNRIEGVVFISQNQRTHWIQRGFAPKNETIILNGIDIALYSPDVKTQFRDETRGRLDLAPDDFVVGFCAVMRPEKNHLQMIEAVAWLRQQGFPAKALLVGDGLMRPAIEERARSLGITDAVIFAGMHSDVRPLIAAFDVGCLCSVSIETLSLAALEIMAMGIPMVMSNLGGASEIIDGRNGRLFPVGDDVALCETLLSLRDSTVRSLAGIAARETVVRQFDGTCMMLKYFKHILSFCS
jgi:glycosyltransferase involved in cell wall biosynthesis